MNNRTKGINEASNETIKMQNDKLTKSLAKIVNWHKSHDPISFLEEADLKEADELLDSIKNSRTTNN